VSQRQAFNQLGAWPAGAQCDAFAGQSAAVVHSVSCDPGLHAAAHDPPRNVGEPQQRCPPGQSFADVHENTAAPSGAALALPQEPLSPTAMQSGFWVLHATPLQDATGRLPTHMRCGPMKVESAHDRPRGQSVSWRQSSYQH
jgi:hypothetical protein